MIEVFVAYTKGTEVARLGATLDAWNMPGLEPIAIQCGLKKFELHRRVSAENVSRGTYILTVVDRAPVEDDYAACVQKELDANPNAGLLIIPPIDTDWVQGAAMICRKGIIQQWVQPLGSQEADVLWDNAHRTSYRNAGYETITCPSIHYRVLVGSSPSSSVMAGRN